MARKRKPKPFKAATAVRSLARERLGTPPPTVRDPNREKEDRQKHKPTLDKLISEES
jgi:hypothetical protein